MGLLTSSADPRDHAQDLDDRALVGMSARTSDTCFIDSRRGLAKARAEVSGVVALTSAATFWLAPIWPAQPRTPRAGRGSEGFAQLEVALPSLLNRNAG